MHHRDIICRKLSQCRNPQLSKLKILLEICSCLFHPFRKCRAATFNIIPWILMAWVAYSSKYNTEDLQLRLVLQHVHSIVLLLIANSVYKTIMGVLWDCCFWNFYRAAVFISILLNYKNYLWWIKQIG